MVIYTENCLWLDRWLVSAERGQISIGELCGSSGSRWLDEMEVASLCGTFRCSFDLSFLADGRAIDR